MCIIAHSPETIKACAAHDDSDIDNTATELLGLWEFVVESYDIDESGQESRFHCRICFDYGICPRCRNVSGDIHQTKRRSVRDLGCFERKVYLVFDLRRFRCPKCHKVFTESLDSIAPSVTPGALSTGALSRWSIRSAWDRHFSMWQRSWE